MSVNSTRHVRHSSPMFRDRLIAALSKRLYPAGRLHRKELAFALGVHGDTFNRWLRGEGSPAGEMVSELVRFFWHQGDRGFAAELFEIEILPPPSAPLAAAVAALEQAKQALLESAAA